MSRSGGAGDDVIDASAFSLSFVIVSGGAGTGTDPADPGDVVDDLSEVDDVFMLMPFPGWIDEI